MKTRIRILLLMVILTTFAEANAQQRPSFNKSKDILIAQFDSKPDIDDIHAQAALGSMLAHDDLKNVKYYAVAGAIGTQGGRFIDSDALFNMAFGNNWTDADANWSASVNKIKNKVIPILQNGGKVWVQEAGQSDITADWIAEVLKTVNAATVKSNVIVVQHSKWNEDKTTNSDLRYVKNKAKYFAIDDGNAPDGASWGDRGPWGTPEYRNKNKSWINRAKSSPNAKAKQLWIEADRVIQNHNHFPSHSHISSGGVDYSDCAENWWIFEIGAKANNITKFWNRYVTNTTGSNPDPNPPGGGDGGNGGDSCVAVERNGVAAVEAEHFTSQSKTGKRKWYTFDQNNSNGPKPDPDGLHKNGSSEGGYLEILPDTRVTHGDPLNGDNFSNDPGKHAIVNYKVKFSSAGKYFVWVRAYSSGTEDNGVHVGINGTWPESGKRLQWCAGKNQWTWESKQRTGANHCGEAQKIFLNVPSAGVHTISFSMREDGFEMDKFVLSKAYNKPTGTGPAEVLTDCNGDGGGNPPTSAKIKVPGTFEAEAFQSKNGSVKTENTPGSSGKNLGFIKNGDYVDYQVEIASDGTYSLDVMASSAGAGGKIEVLEAGSVVGTINITANGKWHTYKKYSANVSLKAGTKKLRLLFKGGNGFLFNVDKIITKKAGNSGSGSQSKTVTLSPIHDAYLDRNTRHNINMIRIEQAKRSGYLMFDLSSVKGNIQKAELKFTIAGDAGNGNVTVHRGNKNNWTEQNLSKNNKPGKAQSLGSINSNFAVGNTKTVALKTGSITGDKLSLIIEATSGNDFAIASKENAAGKPQLVITYTTTRENNIEENAIKIFPNPVVETINFSSEINIGRVKVFNSIGKLQKDVIFEEGENTLDIKNLSTGYYILKIIDTENKVIAVQKIVKQ